MAKKFIEKMNGAELDELAKVVLKSSGCLVAYRALMLEGGGKNERKAAEFHYEWSDILLNGDKSFAIEGFRESAKDQYVMRSFPLHCLTFPKKDLSYIVFVMQNATLAQKKLKEIQREYLNNKLISSNIVKIIEESALAFEVELVAEDKRYIKVRIEAYGKGGSIRGISWGTRRPDIVIMNDVQDIDDARSDTVLENDWDWFLDDVRFLGKSTRIFMIANNLGEKCIIERIANSEDNFGFNFKRVPIADGTTIDSKPAWEDMFPMDFILKERDEYAAQGKLSIWTRNRMCQCVAEEDKCFRSDMFQYFHKSDMMAIASKCNIYLRVDPSAGVKESNDPSAFVVVGINEENHWFIFDVVNERLKQSEKIDTIFRLASKWNLKNCGIENSKEGIILKQDVMEQRPKRNIFFTVIEVKHGNTKKEARIEALEPRFSSKSVWFPQGATWLPELEQQLLMFSRSGKMGLHDDIIDALAYCLDGTQAPIGISGNNNQNIGRRELPRQSSKQVVIRR